MTVAASLPTGYPSTELLVGKDVFTLLEDTGFLKRWDHLYNNCPWATVFQSASFVASWYRVYENEFLPIVIKTEYAGKLTGLLTLAEDKSGLITGAGANQAEYQVWLTADANDETFIKQVLPEMQRFFPRKKFLLKYIPAGVPLGWIKKDPMWNKRCFVKTSPHPVMIINDDHLTSELKKKNRKEKINRLKRLGTLTFERISDYAAFESVFDELALQSDFRKGAMYNKVAFKTDLFRKKFLLTLFEQNNLHATVLKLNDKIIASNVSVSGNNRLHLQGLNSFATAYARYSPGIIHFLMLGKLLAEEGVAVFDLTPGADAYKDTLATDYTEAYTLSIGNNYHGFVNRLKFALNSYLKNTAAFVGVKRDTLKKWKGNIDLYKLKWMNAARQGFTASFACFFNKLKWRRKATTCWVVQKAFIGDTSGFLNIQKDNLKDLLDFDKRDTRYSQQQFLANAMQRFEEGAHCYSRAEEGVLLACAWVAECGNCDNTEMRKIWLSGLYCHPQGGEQFPFFLKSVVAEVAVDIPHEKFYIVANCDDYGFFKKAGFRPVEKGLA
jgi:hypothetical protein